MALTKEDIKAITNALQPQFDRSRREMNDFRLEARQMFQEQGIQISKAITDAIKLITETHATKEEVQELRDELEELRERVKKIERFQKTS